MYNITYLTQIETFSCRLREVRGCLSRQSGLDRMKKKISSKVGEIQLAKTLDDRSNSLLQPMPNLASMFSQVTKKPGSKVNLVAHLTMEMKN
jgi:hypothetical protein